MMPCLKCWLHDGCTAIAALTGDEQRWCHDCSTATLLFLTQLAGTLGLLHFCCIICRLTIVGIGAAVQALKWQALKYTCHNRQHVVDAIDLMSMEMPSLCIYLDIYLRTVAATIWRQAWHAATASACVLISLGVKLLMQERLGCVSGA